MYIRGVSSAWYMGLWEHPLGASIAWSEGGPEPWWGGPYHAIQNWGWEVLWGSGGFPEKKCDRTPLCILLGSDRAAVQRPVIRSTAPTSCLTQLATTLTHICLTSTSISVFTHWPEIFELTRNFWADEICFSWQFPAWLGHRLGAPPGSMLYTEGGWLGNDLQYAGSIMEWAGRWLTHGLDYIYMDLLAENTDGSINIGDVWLEQGT